MVTDRPTAGRRVWGAAAAICLLLAATGCNPARIEAQDAYSGPALPRPDRVLVRDFGLAPESVQLDQGLRARLTRMIGTSSPNQQRAHVAGLVDSTMTETLVQKLRSYGIPAERSAGMEPGGFGTTLVVEGRVLGIDEGNRTRRTLIGFGAGRSSFEISAQLFYQGAGAQPRLLDTFSGTADSGRAPGAAATMGVGGAAGTGIATSALASAGLHGVSERRAAAPEDLARKTAEGLAERIGEFFVAQGWLPQGAVR